MAIRRDTPINPAKPGLPFGATGLADSGAGELVNLASTGTYPNGQTRLTNNSSADQPFNYYDVRGSRAVTVQITSYNVTGTPTVGLFASLDALAGAPLQVYQGGTYVNSFTIPTGGTPTVPLTTLIVIDTPWFPWLQVQVTAAGSAGSAFLTVYKRD